jgi:prepilin-type N-terminal cleavage/methylation domain-containing protein
MRNRMKSKCGDTGFTLIEVALSIAVLALGVLALYTLLSTALDTSAKAKADSQAAMFADGVFNAPGAIHARGRTGNHDAWKLGHFLEQFLKR